MKQGLSLPQLREDLNLFEGPRLRDGSPTWTLHDPLRNLYFRIGWMEFELLSRFRLGSGEAILSETGQLGLIGATEEKLKQLIQFLQQNELVAKVTATQPQKKGGGLQSLLFFKVPLFYPDEWLNRGAAYLTFLFSPLFIGLVMVMGLFSLLMIFQQWDGFWSTFIAFQSPEGVAALGAAILLSKVVHELGHGLSAKHFGLRVPTFGVAFMFLWPVFYTDTSDAWRLRNRRARVLIAAAGMMAETLLAVIASLCWLWLPEGLPKAVAFTVAATSWSITLLVNLNPFMRFDGYFLLSDWWDIPNLQPRAFALARRYLQSWIMGIAKPQPLAGESRQQNYVLISYAYLTWIYRLGLYIGLALVAYHFLFKLLGIALLITELGVLVVRPVFSELQHYWQSRTAFRWVVSNRLLLAVGLLMVGLLVTPWRGQVVAPAVWKQAESQGVYSPAAAQLVSIEVAEGDEVQAGDLLVSVAMPELRYQKDMLRMQIEAQRALLKSAEMDLQGREALHIEQQNLESLLAQQQQVDEKLEKQQLRAPFSGKVTQLSKTLLVGEWVEEGELLLIVADPRTPSLIGYFHERELGRLQPGSRGRFLPEHTQEGEGSVKLQSISTANVRLLEEPLLASLYQGALPVRQGRDGELQLQDSYYRVTFEVKEAPGFVVGSLRGKVVVEAEATTYLQRGWAELKRILIEESGF